MRLASSMLILVLSAIVPLLIWLTYLLLSVWVLSDTRFENCTFAAAIPSSIEKALYCRGQLSPFLVVVWSGIICFAVMLLLRSNSYSICCTMSARR